MSKSSRKRRTEEKKKLKRAAKSARKAFYASLAGTGKRKKKQNQSKGQTAQRGNHAMLNCGNVGCEKCFPQRRLLRANQVPKFAKAS